MFIKRILYNLEVIKKHAKRSKVVMNSREYKAIDIAKWFLWYNRKTMLETDADYISNLKLQKLLYYAQGCSLAIFNKPLFSEKILAWEHGPVVKEVYDEYKNFGRNGIEFEESFDCSLFNKEDESLLEAVYSTFGKYSAWGLREKSHTETPWKETQRNCAIDLDLIKQYFNDNYVKH